MSVTVEGVETQSQAIKMVELHCDQLQGFYFSKPITEPELPLFMLKSFTKGELESETSAGLRIAI